MFLGAKGSSKSKGRRQNKVVHYDNGWCRFCTEPQSSQTKKLTYAKRLAWYGEHLKGQDRQLHSRFGRFESCAHGREFQIFGIANTAFSLWLPLRWEVAGALGWFWEDLYFWWSCKKCTVLWTVAVCRDEVASTAAVQTQDNAVGIPAILCHSPSVLHSGH